MKDQMLFQKILNEIERIQWEVNRVEKNVLMMKNIAEKIFGGEREILKRPYWERNHLSPHQKKLYGTSHRNGCSCVFATNVPKFSPEDKHFIKITEYLDLIFQPLVENNPYILFVYIINKRGVTRGYPWMDFSTLPKDFDPTQHSFFFIADERHNPKKKVKWTEPYLCPLMKTWMVTCSSPVWNHSDFVGVIGIDVNLGKIIEPLGQALKMTEKGYAFIISPRGNLIISSDEGMESLQEDGIWIKGKWKDLKWRDWVCKSPPQNKPLPIRTEIREIRLTSGKRYLLSTFIKTTGWSLVTLLPKEIGGISKKMIPIQKESTPPHLDSYQNHGVYLPLMSFVSAYSKSLKQMEKLIEGTKMIGKGILDHRIEVRTKDEIGLIALSINKMANELKKRKEEFESAYKKISQLDRLMAVGRMAAGIAHEINNPLGVISNYVQILLRNPSLSSEVKIDLMLIEEEIHGMMRIIRGLLNFSRESEMKKSLININDVLRNTVSLLKFQFTSQSIKLLERYDDHLPFIWADPNHLQQVFLNILLNSIQSMPEGGKIELRTMLANGRGPKKSKGWVAIECSDTGVGIDAKDLDKIFDPFFTTKGMGIGTGLGLSISYGIIKEHSGNIDVKSKPGEGTSVKITLPIPEVSKTQEG
jgi:signal transduction histidine kinase